MPRELARREKFFMRLKVEFILGNRAHHVQGDLKFKFPLRNKTFDAGQVKDSSFKNSVLLITIYVLAQ
jgi:hypothetical protein